MARFSDAWNELLHPRDRLGRFRSKWSLKGAKKVQVDSILDRFEPRVFSDPNRAARYGIDESAGQTPAQKRAIRDYVTRNFRAIDAELAQGKTSPETEAIDSAMKPLRDDLLLTVSLGPEAFGLNPNDAQAVEELTGKLIASDTYTPTWLSGGTNNGGIVMHIVAPRGTPAIFPGGAEATIARGQPFRVTKVERDKATGRMRMFVVAVPKSDEKAETNLPEAVRLGREEGNVEAMQQRARFPERAEEFPVEDIPEPLPAPSGPAPERLPSNPQAGEIQPKTAPSPTGDTPGGVEEDGRPSWTVGNNPIEVQAPGGGAGLRVTAGNRVIVPDSADLEDLAVNAQRAGLPEVARWAKVNQKRLKASDSPASAQRAAKRAVAARDLKANGEPNAPQPSAPEANAPAATPQPSAPEATPQPTTPPEGIAESPEAEAPTTTPAYISRPGGPSEPTPAPEAVAPPEPIQTLRTSQPAPAPSLTPVEAAPIPAAPTQPLAPEVPATAEAMPAVDITQPVPANATPEYRAAHFKALQQAARDTRAQQAEITARRARGEVTDSEAGAQAFGREGGNITGETPVVPVKKVVKKAAKKAAAKKAAPVTAETGPPEVSEKPAEKARMSPSSRVVRKATPAQLRERADAAGIDIPDSARSKPEILDAIVKGVLERQDAEAPKKKAQPIKATARKVAKTSTITPEDREKEVTGKAAQEISDDRLNAEQRKRWADTLGGEPKQLTAGDVLLDEMADDLRNGRITRAKAAARLREHTRDDDTPEATYLRQIADLIESDTSKPAKRAPRTKRAPKPAPDVEAVETSLAGRTERNIQTGMNSLSVPELRALADKWGVETRGEDKKLKIKSILSKELAAKWKSTPDLQRKGEGVEAPAVAKKATPEVEATKALRTPAKRAAPEAVAAKALRLPAKKAAPEIEATKALRTPVKKTAPAKQAAPEATGASDELDGLTKVKLLQYAKDNDLKVPVSKSVAETRSLIKAARDRKANSEKLVEATEAAKTADEPKPGLEALPEPRKPSTEKPSRAAWKKLDEIIDQVTAKKAAKAAPPAPPAVEGAAPEIRARKVAKKATAPSAPLAPAQKLTPGQTVDASDEELIAARAEGRITAGRAAKELRRRAEGFEDASVLRRGVAPNPTSAPLAERAAELRKMADDLESAPKKGTVQPAGRPSVKAATVNEPPSSAPEIRAIQKEAPSANGEVGVTATPGKTSSKTKVEGAAPGTAAGKITLSRLQPGSKILIEQQTPGGPWHPATKKTGATVLTVSGVERLGGARSGVPGRSARSRSVVHGIGPDGQNISVPRGGGLPGHQTFIAAPAESPPIKKATKATPKKMAIRDIANASGEELTRGVDEGRVSRARAIQEVEARNAGLADRISRPEPEGPTGVDQSADIAGERDHNLEVIKELRGAPATEKALAKKAAPGPVELAGAQSREDATKMLDGLDNEQLREVARQSGVPISSRSKKEQIRQDIVEQVVGVRLNTSAMMNYSPEEREAYRQRAIQRAKARVAEIQPPTPPAKAVKTAALTKATKKAAGPVAPTPPSTPLPSAPAKTVSPAIKATPAKKARSIPEAAKARSAEAAVVGPPVVNRHVPTPRGRIVPPAHRASGDEPLHLPNAGSDQGLMHLDSELGGLWQALVMDDREPNSFVNEIGRMGDDVGREHIGLAQAIDRLKKMKVRATDKSIADRIQETIDAVDAPPAGKWVMPDDTPPALKKAFDDLAAIPTARRTSGRIGASRLDGSVLDKKLKIMHDLLTRSDSERLTTLDVEQGLAKRDLHESADGATAMWGIFERALANPEVRKWLRVKVVEARARAAGKPATPSVTSATPSVTPEAHSGSTRHTRSELMQLNPGELKEIEDELGITKRPSLLKASRADEILKAEAALKAAKAAKKTASSSSVGQARDDEAKKVAPKAKSGKGATPSPPSPEAPSLEPPAPPAPPEPPVPPEPPAAAGTSAKKTASKAIQIVSRYESRKVDGKWGVYAIKPDGSARLVESVSTERLANNRAGRLDSALERSGNRAPYTVNKAIPVKAVPGSPSLTHTRSQLMNMAPGELKEIESGLGVKHSALADKAERVDAILQAQTAAKAPPKKVTPGKVARKRAAPKKSAARIDHENRQARWNAVMKQSGTERVATVPGLEAQEKAMDHLARGDNPKEVVQALRRQADALLKAKLSEHDMLRDASPSASVLEAQKRADVNRLRKLARAIELESAK